MRATCPCCKLADFWWRFTPAGEPVAGQMPERFVPQACHACGWWDRSHARGKSAPAPVRPPGMSADEWVLRKALLACWLAEPSDEYLARLREFADFLAEQGSPEEAAARADWREYGRPAEGHGRPRATSWLFRPAAGWVHTRQVVAGGTVRTHLDAAAAKLGPAGRQTHNVRWFLGWPPGSVRVTAASYPSFTDFRVTVWVARSLLHSAPYEKRMEHGYSVLFHQPGTLDRPRGPEPDLFAACEVA